MFSNLQQVGDFFFGSKSSFSAGLGGRSQAFFSKFDAILDSWGMIFNSNTRAATGIILALKHLQRPFGVQRRFTRRARSASLMGRTGWTDGWDGRVGRDIKSVLQFSSYFVGIQNMYLLTSIDIYSKIVTNILMAFKILCKVGDRG